jgi:hypothetical protein
MILRNLAWLVSKKKDDRYREIAQLVSSSSVPAVLEMVKAGELSAQDALTAEATGKRRKTLMKKLSTI